MDSNKYKMKRQFSGHGNWIAEKSFFPMSEYQIILIQLMEKEAAPKKSTAILHKGE